MARPIERFIPDAGKVDEAGLRTVDANVLANYVIRASHPWWRRRACVYALRDRVPAAQVEALFDCVCAPADTAEVNCALLEVLPLRESWLPWLREQSEAEGQFGMSDAILNARAALGDLTVASETATLANDLWPHARAIGEAALWQD